MGGAASKPSCHSDESVLRTSNPQTIVVCGAGIVGVSTSWYLALRGHKVICLERREKDKGTDYCSYRNGGLICPSLATPWVTPSSAWKALKSFTDSSSPIVLPTKVVMNSDFWKFGFFATKAITTTNYNKLAKVDTSQPHQALFALANYSLQKFEPLLSQVDLGHPNAHGTLQICTNDASLKSIVKQAKKMQDIGCDILEVSTDECKQRVPMLVDQGLVGGVFGSRDRSGDILLFSKFLRSKCEKLGVKFHYEAEVDTIVTEGSKVVAVKTTQGKEYKGDQFVIAMGLRTREIASSLGVSLPIVPVKGYSITVPLARHSQPLPCNVVDDANKLYLSPIGNLLSISSRAEFGVDNLEVDEKVARDIVGKAQRLLTPGYLDVDKAEYHVCLRPITPDDLPAIGKLKGFDNLFVNAGHGSKGWTQSLGAADVLGHIVDGTTPPIDVTPFSPNRFSWK
eukprot:c844_g1_i1.p1 GENE.c844_g1_i1~~c844_g1_i1.p1  ORF type:complete len:469 (-),score=120.65 c844_g1_i1:110-1471(-)